MRLLLRFNSDQEQILGIVDEWLIGMLQSRGYAIQDITEAVLYAAGRLARKRECGLENTLAHVTHGWNGDLENRLYERSSGMPSRPPCARCGGRLLRLDTVGKVVRYRCQNCGEESRLEEE